MYQIYFIATNALFKKNTDIHLITNKHSATKINLVEKMKAKEQVVMSKNIAHYAFDVKVNNGSISNNDYE